MISVDTSVAHLAGSLGKPVWILLPYVADWRWLLERTDSPRYPTARLFGKPESANGTVSFGRRATRWIGLLPKCPLDRLAEILRDLAEGHQQVPASLIVRPDSGLHTNLKFYSFLLIRRCNFLNQIVSVIASGVRHICDDVLGEPFPG